MSWETLGAHKGRLAGRAADEFYGLAMGVLADGFVNHLEAQFLHRWMTDNPDIVNSGADPLVRRVFVELDEILSDGVFEPAEQKRLLELLMKYTGADGGVDQGVGQGLTSEIPLNDPAPDVLFRGRGFCFTGTFVFGKRAKCADLVESLGGVHSKNVTLDLDYLVVSHRVTPDWRHRSYGAKILKAMEYRDQRGRPLAIISERQLIDAVRDGLRRTRSLSSSQSPGQ